MKNEITIRPAKNHDARKIFNFLCELEEQLFDQQEFEINYRLCLADINNIYLVAAGTDNVAIGYISCHGQILLHHGGMVFEVQELFVEKPYRNKGVGRQLLKGLEGYLNKRAYKSLEVAVNKHRASARKFYISEGFEETHVKLVRAPHPPKGGEGK
ncbi:MAG: GNAT family N-acetyltransferase [Bacteroidetes bacterium]|nr:GNAT family N-acetyltransferase [Bacteroidota bacterium]MBS1973398.1 GNAT family N-acetyltransferase [Bacteroidota bacterium]